MLETGTVRYPNLWRGRLMCRPRIHSVLTECLASSVAALARLPRQLLELILLGAAESARVGLSCDEGSVIGVLRVVVEESHGATSFRGVDSGRVDAPGGTHKYESGMSTFVLVARPETAGPGEAGSGWPTSPGV